jgi:hypothetical protein
MKNYPDQTHATAFHITMFILLIALFIIAFSSCTTNRMSCQNKSPYKHSRMISTF